MLRYNSQKGRGLFKIATLRKWLVVVSSPELIEDVRKAPDDALSLLAYAEDVYILPRIFDSYSHRYFQLFQSKHTMDMLDPSNHYHTDVVRMKLTRNIADIFKDVHDELVMSLEASIPVHGDGVW